jgi:hypothetical protein
LLREVTSADDNGRFVIVAEFFGALWVVFLRWELELAILVMQWHAQVMPPCHCIAKAVSLWYNHRKFFATGVDFNEYCVG